MKASICFLLILLSLFCFATEPDYFSAIPFVEGQAFTKEIGAYNRLPDSAKELIRAPVWNLSLNTAGLLAHFKSDSPLITARWTLLNDLRMVHMAKTGIGGLDLYVLIGKTWQHVATGKPYHKKNDVILVDNMHPKMREYLLYCPLYDGLTNLDIGIDSESEIRVCRFRKKPLVFYGTSITQGGCASRAGMAYPAIVGRRLKREHINLGFSGNGRMDPEMMDLLCDIDAACYILDNLPNMNLAMIDSLAEKGLKKLLTARPKTPVLLVENFIRPASALDTVLAQNMMQENHKLSKIYRKLRKDHRNLHYLSDKKMKEVALNGTVDGIHLTDLGFVNMANVLEKKIKKLIK